MLARASFFPTLAYNVLMERVTARNWWDRVDSQVVLGAIPFKGEAHKLVRMSHLACISDDSTRKCGLFGINIQTQTLSFYN